MFIKQRYSDANIQYDEKGIRFMSHINDGIVANGRRSELSSLYTLKQDTQQYIEWETLIPDDWENDTGWCVIAQVHKVGGVGSGPNFAVELTGDNMIIKVRDVKSQSHYIYQKPIIKGERLKFKAETRWTTLNNGYIRVYINDILEAEYKGSTNYEGATGGGYFKLGMYMGFPYLEDGILNEKAVQVKKRVIYHRI